MTAVQVYYNLHKHLLSVRDKKARRVTAHVPAVTLTRAKFVVQQGGRERVLQEQRKNVHALVDGFLLRSWTDVPVIPEGCFHVRYNPYKYSTFVHSDTEEPIYESPFVVIHGKDIWAW